MKSILIKQITNTIKKSNDKSDMERAENLAGKYLRGVARPSYENIILIEEKLSIPFTAWKDIKSFLSNNNTTTKEGNTSRVQG